jgi:hypothetical protein
VTGIEAAVLQSLPALALDKSEPSSFKISCTLSIPNYNQQDATFLIYLFLQTLYMFQAFLAPIIRST